MELSERKKAILSAIVKMYIRSGEPIGSKMLCEILDNAPSSATLRNEMNALCDLGLLSQPHTSAGRVPTADGYRLYVETLMDKGTISEEQRDILDAGLNFSNCDPEKLPEKAVEILTSLTGLPCFSAKLAGGGITLKQVQLLPMGNRSALLIIITSDGRSRSRLCTVPVALTAALIAEFERNIIKKVIGSDIEELTPAKMQSVTVGSGINILSLMPLITALSGMIEDIKASGLNIQGASNFFTMGLTRESADRINSIISSKDTITDLVSKSDKPLGIIFGDDTEYSALKPSSIVLARYGAGGKDIGCLGVIGPNRMSYEKILPCVQYAAERINTLLNSTLQDMEEI